MSTEEQKKIINNLPHLKPDFSLLEWANKIDKLECYFIPDKKTTSATICANCGREKFLHTIGEGIKATKIIITN